MSRSSVSLAIAVLGTIVLAYVLGIGGFGRSGGPGRHVFTGSEPAGSCAKQVRDAARAAREQYPDADVTVSDEVDCDDPEGAISIQLPEDGVRPPSAAGSGTGGAVPDLQPLPPAVHGVRTLYDDRWIVEEGQWWIGNGETYGTDDSTVSYKKLLESAGREAVVITTPGLYGQYRTRVELVDARPALPGWCEDAAEASLHLDADPSAFQMGSFETFTDPYGLPSGWYRVRYCAEQQDLAAGQEEFTGEEYTTYAGRHLIQVWKAPRSPDRTLLQGSTWARNLAHSG